MVDTLGGAPENLASNLMDVLAHGPILKQSPNVALTIAKSGGDMRDKAQAMAGIAHARALDLAAQQMHQQELNARTGYDISSTGQQVANRAEPGGLNPIPGIERGVQGLGQEVSRGIAHIGASATATQGGSGDNAGGIAPGVTTPQFTTGVQQGTGTLLRTVGQQVNPLTLMGTPQHLFRTWSDIEARHGPGAMVEAMVPSLVGAGAGFFLTHGGGGTEEGINIGEELAGATDTSQGAARVAEATNAAQKTGQFTRNIIVNAAKPITVPAGAIMKAATAVGTSPTFLGANVGGMATQLVPSFKQSWDRTQNGMPRGETGSFGRAIANLGQKIGIPGLEPGSGAYKTISGSLDGFSDIAVLDPLGAGGRLIGQARGEGLGGVLGRFYGGTVIKNPTDIDRILNQYGSARDFVADAAKLNGAQILDKYGTKVTPLLALRLGQASTVEEATNVLKDMARSTELTSRLTSMPTLTKYTELRYGLTQGENAAGETSRTSRLVNAITTPLPTMYDEEAMAFSPHEFSAGDPNAIPAIMHYLRIIGERPQTVNDIGQILLESSDPKLWADTMSNVSQVALARQVTKALGDGPLTEAMKDSINKRAQELFGGRGAGFDGQYGYTSDGTPLSKVWDNVNNESRSAGIFFTQQGKMVMPKLGDVQKISKQIAGVVNYSSRAGLYAKGQNLRDWLDNVVNQKFFQPLALATGGWALRVSSSEVLLNALRLGPLNFSASAIARSAAKHDLAIGVIQQDPRALADMDRLDILLQKGIQSSEAKNYAARAASNLTRNLIAATRGVLAGTEEALLEGIGRQRFLDAATKLMLLHDGEIIPEAYSSAHNLPLVGQDAVQSAQSDIRSWLQSDFGDKRKIKNIQVGPDYASLAPNQNGYFSEWSKHAGLISADHRLGRPVAASLLRHLDEGFSDNQAAAMAMADARSILRDIPEQERAYMSRDAHMEPGSDAIDPHDDWSQKAVQAILGTVRGQYGPIHTELLHDIANGTVPQTAKDMIDKYGVQSSEHFINPDHRPPHVPGRLPITGGSQVLQRAASYLHTNYLSRVVNYLSREPTFIADFANESKVLESQVRDGTITQDQADVIAQTRALFKSIRFIHNPQDRMKVEQEFHIVAPFWFAKNQAIRRAGRLFATNPGALEQYLKVNLAVQNIAFQANQNGQSYFLFPGSGVVGSAVTGGVNAAGHVPMFQNILGESPVGSIPVGLSGSTDTMQSVVPWAGNGESAPGSPLSLEQTLASPSLGPLGAIPVRVLSDFANGHVKSIADNTLGPVGSTEPWWTYLVPNSILQHLTEAGAFAIGSNDVGTSAMSANLNAIAALSEQNKGTEALTQVQPSDASGATPAPGTAVPNVWQQAQLLKRAKAMTVANLMARLVVSGASPVSVALSRADLKINQEVQTYVNKAHGNLITGIDNFMRDHPDEVASSVFQSTSNVGSGWGDTAKDGAWMQANMGLIKKYPNAAQYLIPPKDNVGPFSEATHMLQMAEDLRHEDTPQEFLQNVYIASGNAWYYNGVNPQLQAALKSNPGDAYNIYNRVDQIIKNYGNRNPVWVAYWNAQQSSVNRGQSIQQLETMLKDPSVPKNAQTTHLNTLVDSYKIYQGDKANAGSSAARATLKAQWNEYLTQRVNEWPDVTVAVSDLFSHLG